MLPCATTSGCAEDEQDIEGVARSIYSRFLSNDIGVVRESPSSSSVREHVVIVMDALESFSMEPLSWALTHVIKPGSAVTFLGVLPWMPFILSCKMLDDVWMMDLGGLSMQEAAPYIEQHQSKNDSRYQKIHSVVQLCSKYGVVPYIKVAQGLPRKLVVLEQIINLHASWVVFDRHLRKMRAFFKKKVPCNLVMLNRKGEVDVLGVRPMLDSGTFTPSAFPPVAPHPQVVMPHRENSISKGKE